MLTLIKDIFNRYRFTKLPVYVPTIFNRLHPRPESIQLSISDACNYKCEMCLMHSNRLGKADCPDEIDGRYYQSHSKVSIMQSELFYRVAEQIVEFKIPEVNICGRGEPLLNPRALDYIKHLRASNISVRLTTNGSLLTTDMIDEISHLLTGLSISLNSVIPLNHKKLHHSKKEDFNHIVKIIDYYLSQKDKCQNNPFRISVSFVLSKLNIAELDDILLFVKSRRCPCISFGLVHLGVYPHTEDICLDEKEYKTCLEKTIKFKKEK